MARLVQSILMASTLLLPLDALNSEIINNAVSKI